MSLGSMRADGPTNRALPGILGRVQAALEERRRKNHFARELAALDERMLADIGMTRNEARACGAKDAIEERDYRR
jgi:uncharacterized protein YjiS (DUF1127 family)